MSAPVVERPRAATRTRTTTIPAQRGLPGTTAAPQTRRSGSEQKAYARREDRLRQSTAARAVPAGRPQFVLLIMVLLVVGLVATLWLSTAAAADSYRLKDATAAARELSEQVERLHREVATMQSAPELARRAAELGMTQVQDPARLVVALDGGVEVVGQPRAAVAPAPPAPPVPPGATPVPGAVAPGEQPGTGADGAALPPVPAPGGPQDAAVEGAAGDRLAAGAAAPGDTAAESTTGDGASAAGTSDASDAGTSDRDAARGPASGGRATGSDGSERPTGVASAGAGRSGAAAPGGGGTDAG